MCGLEEISDIMDGEKGEFLIFPLEMFPSQSWFMQGNAFPGVAPDWLKGQPREMRRLGG